MRPPNGLPSSAFGDHVSTCRGTASFERCKKSRLSHRLWDRVWDRLVAQTENISKLLG
jgi:hypothetical protein